MLTIFYSFQKTCALVKDCDWVYVDKIERPAIIARDAMKPNLSKEFEVCSVNFVDESYTYRVLKFIVEITAERGSSSWYRSELNI